MAGTTMSLRKKTGLDLGYLDTHITCDPDLCPLDTYLARLQGPAYERGRAAWCSAFPEGVAARLGIKPEKPQTLQVLEKRFGPPSLTYNAEDQRYSWVFADQHDNHIVAIDWGIFSPGVTLCVKSPDFDTGLKMSEAILQQPTYLGDRAPTPFAPPAGA